MIPFGRYFWSPSGRARASGSESTSQQRRPQSVVNQTVGLGRPGQVNQPQASLNPASETASNGPGPLQAEYDKHQGSRDEVCLSICREALATASDVHAQFYNSTQPYGLGEVYGSRPTIIVHPQHTEALRVIKLKLEVMKQCIKESLAVDSRRQETREQLAQAQRQNEYLEQKFYHEQHDHEQTKCDLQISQQTIAQIQNELSRTKELLRLQKQDLCRPKLNTKKVSDSAIQAQWKQMAYNIKNLAHTLASNPANPRHISPELWAELEGICPDARAVWRNKLYCRAMIQAYVWISIDYSVFNGHGNIWGGSEGGALIRAKRDLIGDPISQAEKLPALAKWFAEGASLIEINLEDGELIAFVKKTADLLASCLPKPHTDGQTNMIREEILTIAEDAIELQNMFMNSRALIEPRWETLKNGSETMEDARNLCYNMIEQDESCAEWQRLCFAVSPWILKIGNAEGQKFDQSMVLVKGEAVLPDACPNQTQHGTTSAAVISNAESTKGSAK